MRNLDDLHPIEREFLAMSTWIDDEIRAAGITKAPAVAAIHKLLDAYDRGDSIRRHELFVCFLLGVRLAKKGLV